MQLQDYLKQSNIRASHFANELGVFPSTVTRWITGEKFPNPAHMKKIAEVTDNQVNALDFLEALE